MTSVKPREGAVVFLVGTRAGSMGVLGKERGTVTEENGVHAMSRASPTESAAQLVDIQGQAYQGVLSLRQLRY
jgi:hypothetical protein